MTVAAEPRTQTFLERVGRARSQTVVVHTGSGRSYAGVLLEADHMSVRLESDSEDYDAPCILEIDAGRVEAIEVIRT